MGGNPYGPAGTGKTESVKALGNLFGRQVLVFNCDEGIDVKSMGRIFVGKSAVIVSFLLELSRIKLSFFLLQKCCRFNSIEKTVYTSFTGLVKCGAWGCFDEFNRLEEAVLSAVSTQIQVIQAGIMRNSPTLQLMDKQVRYLKYFSSYCTYFLEDYFDEDFIDHLFNSTSLELRYKF